MNRHPFVTSVLAGTMALYAMTGLGRAASPDSSGPYDPSRKEMAFVIKTKDMTTLSVLTLGSKKNFTLGDATLITCDDSSRATLFMHQPMSAILGEKTISAMTSYTDRGAFQHREDAISRTDGVFRVKGTYVYAREERTGRTIVTYTANIDSADTQRSESYQDTFYVGNKHMLNIPLLADSLQRWPGTSIDYVANAGLQTSPVERTDDGLAAFIVDPALKRHVSAIFMHPDSTGGDYSVESAGNRYPVMRKRK